MPELPHWLMIAVRSISFLIILFLLTKWLGKRQISQLSFFEYITGITIGNIAAEVSMGIEQSFSDALIGILVWSAVPFLVGFISLKSKRIRNFVEGEATIFIKDGKVLEDNLKKEKYTIDELMELLRKKDVFNVSDVEFALLEPNGTLNILLKKENQPLTPKVLGLKVAQEKETQTVIMDGKILNQPLSASGHNQGWLRTELEKLGVTLDNVFIGQVDSYGQLTVDLYDDKFQTPSPQEKPLLLATLKKCQADLELFALETGSVTAQNMYTKNASRMQGILDKVTYLLKE
ncbi:DUF421 domain-containing protein [Ectobacillus funiculus]|uniref:DUF421 domain-containing protein n=1 Tax=Ectobacillus funiculus TaxID=137993 RepID=A0ABV5WKZ9_9BACI